MCTLSVIDHSVKRDRVSVSESVTSYCVVTLKSDSRSSSVIFTRKRETMLTSVNVPVKKNKMVRNEIRIQIECRL